MREIKFRAWLENTEIMEYPEKTWNLFMWAEDEGQPIKIMQYTGLKDKNGTEIYSGDIIKGTGEHVGHYNVFYDLGQWQPFAYLGSWNGDDFEVIGNVHENPELLNED